MSNGGLTSKYVHWHYLSISTSQLNGTPGTQVPQVANIQNVTYMCNFPQVATPWL